MALTNFSVVSAKIHKYKKVSFLKWVTLYIITYFNDFIVKLKILNIVRLKAESDKLCIIIQIYSMKSIKWFSD